MRGLIAVLATVVLSGAIAKSARAQEVLPLDFGSFDKRLTALEQRVTSLEQVQSVATAAVPKVVRTTQAYVIPPGHHAHRTVDGRTIVHSDALNGNAAAHVGVAPPWVITARAGQTVYVSSQSGASQAGFVSQSSGYSTTTSISASSQFGCPAGGCPAPQRRGLFGRR